MKRVTKGGGWPAIMYAWRMARQSGGIVRFLRALSTKNACKTCALGMGGQLGGMTDESGRFPEICKKSMQAMAADMRGRVEPRFFDRYGFVELQRFSPRELEAAGRLVSPVYAGPGDSHYRVLTWDEAMHRCVERLKAATPAESFFYASGRSSNEAAFLLQLFARMYGTNNVNNCSYYCHQASGVALSGAIGNGTATVTLDDVEQCDCFFLIGGNPASNHPRLMRNLVKLRRRGGSIIIINPIRETGLVNFAVPSDLRSLLFGSPIASEYLQPHIGGDPALLCGIAKRVDELGAANDAFARNFTEGWDKVRQHLRELPWETIVSQSGVDAANIHRAARTYASARRAIFAWTMGITHHLHGVDNVRAIINLALMQGMVGVEGAGLLPIRGHSNVQGVGSVGVTPKLKDAVMRRLEEHFGAKLPTEKGLDTLSCIEAAHAGELRNAWCLGGNLFGATPDPEWTRNAFARMDWVCYLSTTLNTGHAWGRAKETMILPMRARDEESQATTQESMFNYVRLSEGGPARHDGPRSEVETIAALAGGVLGDDGPIEWRALREHRSIRQAIAAIVPGFEELDRIDETRSEFQIPGRTLHRPTFSTASGRAKFHVIPLAADQGVATPVDADGADGKRGSRVAGHGNRSLRLMTIRSEGQFNTVVYDEEDLYRHQERRDVILMNAADIARFGLRENQRVSVQSATGRMDEILVRGLDIREGNAAMYYPEANVLVSTAADPESRTPAFKSVDVEIVTDATQLPVLRT